MILSLLESGLARLGWIVLCAHCGRHLPYGAPRSLCQTCFYGYVTPEKTWQPKA